MMRDLSRTAAIAALTLLLGCSAAPTNPPPDPALQLLDANEPVALRLHAELMHGHDMEEPSYDAPEGYQPIEVRQGELLITDRRLLWIEANSGVTLSWVSIPLAAIARARPSRTPLLHYLVVWDAQGHPDSFLVSAKNVQPLHRSFGQAMMASRQQRQPASISPTYRHEFPGKK